MYFCGEQPPNSPFPCGCLFSVTFIDLFNCVAASLFNKLTYLRIPASTYYVVLLAHPRLRPKPHVNRAAAFLLLTVNCPYNGSPKMPLSLKGILNVVSGGPHEPTTQTASRSGYPFLQTQGCVRQTDTHTTLHL